MFPTQPVWPNFDKFGLFVIQNKSLKKPNVLKYLRCKCLITVFYQVLAEGARVAGQKKKLQMVMFKQRYISFEK